VEATNLHSSFFNLLFSPTHLPHLGEDIPIRSGVSCGQNEAHRHSCRPTQEDRMFTEIDYLVQVERHKDHIAEAERYRDGEGNLPAGASSLARVRRTLANVHAAATGWARGFKPAGTATLEKSGT
jgi:hypothetical protein